MKKPKVLALVSNGVEEMELVITVDLLRRAGIDVDIVSIQDQIVECSRNVKIVADKTLDLENLDEFIKEYDALFIPGGSNNAQNLKNHEPTKIIIEHFMNSNKIVSAICAGPTVINKHYKLDNYKATCYPTLKEEIPNFEERSVVEDRNLITSQGPATTFEFALKLIEKLKNKETRETVSKATLFEEYFKISKV